MDDETYGQERLSLMFPGAWGQKRPQNTGVWPLALLGSWVAGMSGPLDTGEGAGLLRRCSRGLSAALRQLQVGVRQLR